MKAADRIPNAQIAAVTALVCALTAASWWTHAGPWAWITELQVVWLGSVAPALTAGVVIGGGAAVALVPLALWHAARGTPAQPRPDLSWMHTGAGKAALVGAVLCGIALFQAAEALRAGALVDVRPEDLAHTSARYVRVPPERAVLEAAIGLDRDWYVPVLDGDRVIAVYAVSPLGEPGPADLEPGEGMWAAFGLPGAVISAWRQEGLVVEPRVPVVDLEASPGRAWFMAGLLGFIGAPVGGVGALLVRRRASGAA